jgi:GT2 family glycosyltransferase
VTRFRKVSVIVPTLNEESVVDTVQSIRANRPDIPFEICVVGRDEAGRLRDFSDVRFVDTGQRKLPSVSRNLGAARTDGDLLLFTDSDCVADQGWITGAAQALGADKHVVGGGIRFPEGNIWDLGDNLAVFHALHVSQPPRRVTGHVGANNLAITREAFQAVGGFNPDLWVGEDDDLQQRLRGRGYEIFFDPRFAVLHRSGRNDRASVVRHAVSYGEGYLTLLRGGYVPQAVRPGDRLARCPVVAAFWSAARAGAQTAAVFGSHPAFWRYLRAAPVVWLFYYARRRAIFRLLKNSR